MKLLMQDPNPLNILGIRELDTMPIHFEKIDVRITTWRVDNVTDDIKNWIYNNLDGRFSVVPNLKIIDNKLENICQIGFEKGSELSYFSLACSVLSDDECEVV